MKYKWTCENITKISSVTKCVFADGKDLGFDSESEKLSFEAGKFWNSSVMRWTLEVSKGPAVDLTYARIEVVENQVVTVGIRTVKESVKVNRNKLIILSAAAYSQLPYNLTYAWSSDPILPSSSFVTGTAEKYLKISPYSLSEDSRYTFTCAVTEPDGSKGEAVIRVTVNRAPRFGTFTVSPSSGIVYQTVFELKAEGWRDDDVPLTYVFSYEDPQSNQSVPLGERTESATLTTLLGLSHITSTITLRLKLEVFDSLNASTVSYFNVDLDSSRTSTVQNILETVSRSSAVSNGGEKIQLLAMVGQQLNCGYQNQSEQCAKMLSLLRTTEVAMDTVSTETDATLVNILDSMNHTSGEHAGVVLSLLNDAAQREARSINKILSVADDQLESKKVKYGLNAETTVQMLRTLGATITKMSSAQKQTYQGEILTVADTVGRSMLKDAVPNEPEIIVNSGTVTVMAQKVARCVEKGVKRNYTVNGIEVSLPICEILSVNQTLFQEKTLNKMNPYDLVVEVLEENVMGECVPLSSKLLRVVIFDDESKSIYAVSNLSSPIDFTFQLDTSQLSLSDDDLFAFSCAYYSPELGDFTTSTIGTTLLDAQSHTYRCTTTHLSEFAMIYTLSSQSKSWLDLEFWLLLILLILCVSMHIWAALYDKKYKSSIEAEISQKSQKAASKMITETPTKDRPFKQPYSGTKNDSSAIKEVQSERGILPENSGSILTHSSGLKLLSLVLLVPL